MSGSCVACLANLSASSFPWISMCEGTHCIVMSKLFSESWLVICRQSFISYVVMRFEFRACIADFESENITIFQGCMFSFTQVKALYIAYISAIIIEWSSSILYFKFISYNGICTLAAVLHVFRWLHFEPIEF